MSEIDNVTHPTTKFKRRSSILKVITSPTITDCGDPTETRRHNRTSYKRVSFAATKEVKEFEQWSSESQNVSPDDVKTTNKPDENPENEPTVNVKGIDALLSSPIRNNATENDQLQELLFLEQLPVVPIKEKNVHEHIDRRERIKRVPLAEVDSNEEIFQKTMTKRILSDPPITRRTKAVSPKAKEEGFYNWLNSLYDNEDPTALATVKNTKANRRSITTSPESCMNFLSGLENNTTINNEEKDSAAKPPSPVLSGENYQPSPQPYSPDVADKSMMCYGDMEVSELDEEENHKENPKENAGTVYGMGRINVTIVDMGEQMDLTMCKQPMEIEDENTVLKSDEFQTNDEETKMESAKINITKVFHGENMDVDIQNMSMANTNMEITNVNMKKTSANIELTNETMEMTNENMEMTNVNTEAANEIMDMIEVMDMDITEVTKSKAKSTTNVTASEDVEVYKRIVDRETTKYIHVGGSISMEITNILGKTIEMDITEVPEQIIEKNANVPEKIAQIEITNISEKTAEISKVTHPNSMKLSQEMMDVTNHVQEMEVIEEAIQVIQHKPFKAYEEPDNGEKDIINPYIRTGIGNKENVTPRVKWNYEATKHKKDMCDLSMVFPSPIVKGIIHNVAHTISDFNEDTMTSFSDKVDFISSTQVGPLAFLAAISVADEGTEEVAPQNIQNAHPIGKSPQMNPNICHNILPILVEGITEQVSTLKESQVSLQKIINTTNNKSVDISIGNTQKTSTSDIPVKKKLTFEKHQNVVPQDIKSKKIEVNIGLDELTLTGLMEKDDSIVLETIPDVQHIKQIKVPDDKKEADVLNDKEKITVVDGSLNKEKLLKTSKIMKEEKERKKETLKTPHNDSEHSSTLPEKLEVADDKKETDVLKANGQLIVEDRLLNKEKLVHTNKTTKETKKIKDKTHKIPNNDSEHASTLSESKLSFVEEILSCAARVSSAPLNQTDNPSHSLPTHEQSMAQNVQTKAKHVKTSKGADAPDAGDADPVQPTTVPMHQGSTVYGDQVEDEEFVEAGESFFSTSEPIQDWRLWYQELVNSKAAYNLEARMKQSAEAFRLKMLAPIVPNVAELEKLVIKIPDVDFSLYKRKLLEVHNEPVESSPEKMMKLSETSVKKIVVSTPTPVDGIKHLTESFKYSLHKWSDKEVVLTYFKGIVVVHVTLGNMKIIRKKTKYWKVTNVDFKILRATDDLVNFVLVLLAMKIQNGPKLHTICPDTTYLLALQKAVFDEVEEAFCMMKHIGYIEMYKYPYKFKIEGLSVRILITSVPALLSFYLIFTYSVGWKVDRIQVQNIIGRVKNTDIQKIFETCKDTVHPTEKIVGAVEEYIKGLETLR